MNFFFFILLFSVVYRSILKPPKLAPLHLVGGTQSLFFLTRVLGVYVSGFGACRTLVNVSLIYFAVNSLSQLNRSWAWLTNAPMPQPLSVLGCVVKAKCIV